MTMLISFLVVWHLMFNIFTIYVHRGQGHHNFTFNPWLASFFRFYLWLTVGMIYPHWAENYAAKHRKHHKYSDTEQDPHSPFYQSLGEIMDQRNHSITLEEIKLYAPDIITPVTWMDKNVYFKYPKLGLAVHWLGQTLAFGIPGFIIGMLFYFYIAHVFFFCGNYLVHKIGFTCATNKGADRSKIVFPIGIIMGGEELHANHHNDVTNPNFRKRWWEFDSGWMYAKLLIAAGLVKIVK